MPAMYDVYIQQTKHTVPTYIYTTYMYIIPQLQLHIYYIVVIARNLFVGFRRTLKLYVCLYNTPL